MAAAQSMRWVSGNSHAKQPDYSLEPTLLAGENADGLLPARVRENGGA